MTEIEATAWGFVIMLDVLVSMMAYKRGRSVTGWFLMALAFSPLFAAIALKILGTAESKDGPSHDETVDHRPAHLQRRRPASAS